MLAHEEHTSEPSCQCGYDLSCFQRIAGTLTREEILEHKLVQPGDNEHKPVFQATTVDLTVGDGHYLFDGTQPQGQRRWKLVFIGDAEKMEQLNKTPSTERYTRSSGDKPHTLTIPPYGSALVQLNEIVDTATVARDPNKNLLVVGRFDLKLSKVHQGLISQQATQIEPCYRGKLFCFIHNLSNTEIDLNWGKTLATIEFSYVSCFCNRDKKIEIITELFAKTKDKYSTRKFCDDYGIQDIRYFYETNRLPDDCGLVGFQKNLTNALFAEENLDKLAKKVDKRIEKWIKLVPIIVSFLTIIGSIIVATIPVHTLENKCATLEEEILQLREDLEEIQGVNDGSLDTD